ncbi:MAG: aldehyde dehydrogenase, partial [Proteobacteria bacterium]|nr:aldehyde dehydrogenase [Pseudomonadota bacterium]
MLLSINPANGQTLAIFEEMQEGAVDAALDRARQAQRSWRRQAPAERAGLLAR